MKYFFIAVAHCFMQSAIGQAYDTAIIDSIKKEAFSNSHLKDYAYQLIDGAGSRLTNSNGYNKAVKISVDLLKQAGISNAGREAWGEFGAGWENDLCVASVTSPYKMNLVTYAIPWTRSYTSSGDIRVVLLDALDSASVDKVKNLKGAVAIVNVSEMTFGFSNKPEGHRFTDSELIRLPDRHMITKASLAELRGYLKNLSDVKRYLESKGAVALLSDDGRGNYGTVNVSGYTGYQKNAATSLPEIIVASEQYFKIVRTLQHGEEVRIKLKIENTRNEKDLTGYNVVAEIPGTDPVLKNEIVMIGAHLDSWTAATGATDNGAGCITMMEVMRILKKLNLQTKRTIRICLWGGEEEVLLGSYGYAKKHFGPVERQSPGKAEKISAYYNLDNGTGKIRGIYLQGNNGLKNLFSHWLIALTDSSCKTVSPAFDGGSDHETFDAYNIPAFQFIQDPMEYDTRTHHTNMDTYEHLSFNDLQQAASVITWVVYQTAMKEERLSRKINYSPERFYLEDGFGE